MISMNMNRRILVIGDLILDRYIHGTADRLSPEAPVPIISISNKSITHTLGGAGNVAANVKSLGGTPILISVVGSGDNNNLYRAMDSAGLGIENIFCDGDRVTTTKTRIIANNQQIARMDRETTAPIDTDISNLVSDAIGKIAPSADAIIVSDYAKGVITETLMECIAGCARRWGIPLFVDPKVAHKDWYTQVGITAMTPNQSESSGLVNDRNPDNIGYTIVHLYEHPYCLITRGEHGMSLYSQDATGKITDVTLPTAAKHVFDVSGAGDTVIAALTLAYASGYTMLEAAKIANAAAGIAVGKHGTATVSLEELKGQIDV